MASDNSIDTPNQPSTTEPRHASGDGIQAHLELLGLSSQDEQNAYLDEERVDFRHRHIALNQEQHDMNLAQETAHSEPVSPIQSEERVTMQAYEPTPLNNQPSHDHGAEQQDGYELQHYSHSSTANLPSITQPNNVKTKSSIVHRVWLWELAASVFSIACVAVVAGILSYEQNKPLAQWQRGLGKNISPTAVVSFLGTVGKSASLVAVTEIISQLKWLHFGPQPRQLVDLQIFDEASRGPWGAFKLVIAKNKAALLAGSASIITIAALLMDPFIQLVFSFPSKLTPASGASVPILASESYDPEALASRNSQCYTSANVGSVMQAAILSPVWNATRAPALPCSFERCEWPTITMLGVCTKCFDLTDTVIPNCKVAGPNRDQVQCNYTLPTTNSTFNTLFAVTGGAAERLPYQPLWNSTVRMYSPDGLALFNPTTSNSAQITKFSFIRWAPDLPWQSYIDFSDIKNYTLTSFPAIKQAMQCNLELCARTFNEPSYANFSVSQLSGPETPLYVAKVPLATSDRVLVDLKPLNSDHIPLNTTFQVNLCDYKDLTQYLGELFSTEHSSGGMTGTLNAIQPRSIVPNIGPSLNKIENVEALMKMIAGSMTEVIRTSANSTVYNGTGWNTVTYISINWWWMSLPIALVVLTFIMLVIIIVRNNARDIPAWKSSGVALLFHDLDGWDRSDLEVDGPEDLIKRASKMTARVSDEGRVPMFSRHYS